MDSSPQPRDPWWSTAFAAGSTRYVSEAGDEFRLFLWFDGSGYQVKVVSPDVDHHRSHACHLFADGRICLGGEAGGGLPTLVSAYARSVVWANGFSAFLRRGAFPY